jgi:limonene-1,2-epoxide hydrolase
MSENIAVVEAFIDAWNRYDLETIESMVTPDIFYHNIPMEPCIGLDSFKGFVRGWQAVSATWVTHAIAANGNIVLTERTDGFSFADGSRMSIRVMGAFEIQDGKISKWRDYFDPAEARPIS